MLLMDSTGKHHTASRCDFQMPMPRMIALKSHVNLQRRLTCGGKECKCELIAAHARMMADADAATTLFLGSCCHQLCP